MAAIFKDDERTILFDDKVRSKVTLSIDPKASPKAIDFTVTEGLLAGRSYFGIYEMKNDTLKICLTLQGSGRPADFRCNADSNSNLQVFKRKKKSGTKVSNCPLNPAIPGNATRTPWRLVN
jgi:uncharacterized protein (TIGR03067 family)